MNYLLITAEVLLAVVTPLFLLYRRSTWPLPATTLSLVVVPVLWYPVYAPIHELSHLAAVYVLGGTVTSMKLIPSFWAGEFAVAWIRAEGLTGSWQQLVMTSAPYVVDLLCLLATWFVLTRRYSRKAFIVGLVFMLLCLRPAFDLLCESISYATGFKGDLYHLEIIIGPAALWAFIVASIGFSLFVIVTVLKRFTGFPGSIDGEQLSRAVHHGAGDVS
jgi:hypothetical protein